MKKIIRQILVLINIALFIILIRYIYLNYYGQPTDSVWNFCYSYSPGGHGGLEPGYHTFTVSVMAQSSSYQVDYLFLKDRKEFDLNANNKINYYMDIDKIHITTKGVRINYRFINKETQLKLGSKCIDSTHNINEIKEFLSINQNLQ